MKKKVVLYFPSNSQVLEQKQPPMALLAISKLLRKNGYEIVILSRNEKNHKERIIKELEDAVCFGMTTLTGYQIKEGLKIAEIVRKARPEIPIVWGGWHPSIMPVQTAEHPLVDIVVYGQGERTFYELVERLYNKKSLKNIKGIVFKNKKNEIIMNPPRETESPDNFPPMPYELLDMENFMINSEIGNRSTYYITSHGCPFRCGFCADRIVYKRRWKALSAKNTVKEIKNLVKKYDVNGIFISDSNFFVDEKRVADICRGLIEQNVNVNLGYLNGRADQLNRYNPETFKLMQKANMKSILIGAESPNQEVLNYITKDENVEEIVKITERCKKYGIKIYFSFVIGFPPKNPEESKNYQKNLKKEFREILNFIDQLMKIEKDNVFAIFIYTPYPGAPLYDKSLENGFIAPRSLEEWANFDMDKQNVPWVPRKYQKIIEQLNLLYFPVMSNNIYEIYKDSRLFNFLYRIAYAFIRTRWKYRLFEIPVEYYLMRMVLKTKMKIAS